MPRCRVWCGRAPYVVLESAESFAQRLDAVVLCGAAVVPAEVDWFDKRLPAFLVASQVTAILPEES